MPIPHFPKLPWSLSLLAASLFSPLAFAYEAGNAGEACDVFADFAEWVDSYFAAGEAARGAMVTDGRRLAEARQKALKALMESAAEKAMGKMLSPRKLKQLPPSIRECMERPFSGRGTLRVMAIDNFEQGTARFERHLDFEGRTYRAFTVISATDLVINEPLLLEGYLLGRRALLTKAEPAP